MMRNQLTKAINVIDQGVNKLKSYTFKGLNSNPDTKRNSTADKFSINSMNATNGLINASGVNQFFLNKSNLN